MNAQDFTAAAPLIILTLTGCVCLLLEVAGVPVGARKVSPRSHIALLAVIGLAAAALWQFVQFSGELSPSRAFSGALRIDHFGLFFGALICVGAILAILVAVSWLRARDLERGEYYAIIVFASMGMVALAQAADFLFLFVALETLSVGVYVLAGLDRDNSRSPEGALKYFLNGAFAAGILLFGMALVYGATGSTAIHTIGPLLRGGAVANQPLALTGFVMIVLGLGFKIAAVPFHMWTPDVYDGSPAPSTAFMAAGVKAAAFAALIRVVVAGLGPGAPAASEGWIVAGWIFAVATMSVGNLAALAQRRVKRMLAYSSIAHAGYALAGVVAAIGGHAITLGAVGFYLLVYALMTVGSFGVVGFLERADGKGGSYDEWAGSARRYPLVGLAMAVFIFSLAGIPPTAGFLAKFQLFSQIVDGKMYWLAFIGILNSLISVYYYLRVLVFMYMKEPHPKLDGRGGAFLATGLTLAALLILAVGMMPTTMMEYASRVLDVVKI